MSDETKFCPECAETVKAQATLCRYCKYDFVAKQGARVGAPLPTSTSRSGINPVIIVVIVLFLAVPVIAIIAAIAIPGLLASQRAANERNASVTLKILASTQADFRANDRDGNQVNDFWTADIRGLNGPEFRLIDPALAGADASPGGISQPVPKAGYYFMALKLDADGTPYDAGKGRNPLRFAFCAYPATPSSGRKTFLINEENTVWMAIVGGRPVVRWPANPQAEGWTKLD